MNDVNFDNIVDYKQEYMAVIQQPKLNGDRLTGLCPFHADKNASFSVDLATGKYICFACGASGNFVTFWAGINNVDTKEAFSQICEKYGIVQSVTEYTVDDYAVEKRLPASFLREKFKLTDAKEKDGTPYIKIPYFNEKGVQVLFRKRFHKSNPTRFKWKYGSQGKLTLYAENTLKYIRDVEKRAILVEGESDTQTLIYLGFPALGVPGAATFHEEWAAKLKGIDRVYLHVEPDGGGQTFLGQMTRKLHDGGYAGEVYRFSCGDYGAKDPSELFVRDGKEAAVAKLTEALDGAARIDMSNLAAEVPAAIDGAPINLRQPSGFFFNDSGITAFDANKNAQLVCRTPILIRRRLRGVDSYAEKIELTFKRDGEWQSVILPRSTVFQSKSVTCLADHGCTVTSENARQIVRFLEKLEAENIDIIPRVDSTSTFGWQSKERFMPGFAPDTVLDVEPSLRGWAAAYAKEGSLKEWLAMMRPHRNRQHKFRFILAASFTAPLLRILRQRIFFVYNWGGSKGGKSAAIKAALSVWGDPERLMVNFNATQVALERMAGFYCDLPLGIDERQLAGNNQGAIEKIVYMLASGTGRIRGSKTGGLQALNTWRTVILASGEEPLTTETSQTGVSTRVLELYGPPFDDEISASKMHQSVADNYGFAGEEFMRYVISVGDEELKKRFAPFHEAVLEMLQGRNGAHAAGIAAVALADALISEWLYGESRESAESEALAMAECIIAENAENAARDVNESATEFVFDWIESNLASFYNEARVRYGELSDGRAYIFPSILMKALTDAGYSPRKTLKYMAEKGFIETSEWDGRVRYSVKRRIGYRPVWVISVERPEVGTKSGNKDDPSEWTEVPNDDNLPF